MTRHLLDAHRKGTLMEALAVLLAFALILVLMIKLLQQR